MKRNCLNCAHCELFSGHNDNYNKAEMIRCWTEENVVDHAFCISKEEAEEYKCDNHETKEEYDKRQFLIAQTRLKELNNERKKILEKYPELDVSKDKIDEVATFKSMDYVDTIEDGGTSMHPWNDIDVEGGYKAGFKEGIKWYKDKEAL